MTATLATLRDRIELQLSDASNARYTTTALDEAIQQALDAYTAHLPHRAIATITLTEAGREIDISSLTYLTIEKVWWDYDDTDPDHPPHWRAFLVWPGDILYINDPEEPAAGNVIRIWYTTPHTLKDLNTATTTTFPDPHASIIAQGAAGFAVLARRAEIGEAVNDNPWAPRNLMQWAEEQLTAFYHHLDELARQAAATASGIAPGPILDRWDTGNTW